MKYFRFVKVFTSYCDQVACSVRFFHDSYVTFDCILAA